MKKIFKTLLSYLLLLSIVLSFTACNPSSDESIPLIEPQIIELTKENINEYLYINDSISGLYIPDSALTPISWTWYLHTSPTGNLKDKNYSFINVKISAKATGFGTSAYFFINNIDEKGIGEDSNYGSVHKGSYKDVPSKISIEDVSGTLRIYE